MRDVAVDARVRAAVQIRTYTPYDLRCLCGPAEAQYSDQIVLSLQGAQGSLPCGSTIVDGDANDLHPGVGVEVNFVWTDPAGVETGSRFQIDYLSSTFVTEDFGVEFSAGQNTTNLLQSSIDSFSQTHTARAFAHVGHAPGHGATPIAGDVVSNECIVTLANNPV